MQKYHNIDGDNSARLPERSNKMSRDKSFKKLSKRQIDSNVESVRSSVRVSSSRGRAFPT